MWRTSRSSPCLRLLLNISAAETSGRCGGLLAHWDVCRRYTLYFTMDQSPLKVRTDGAERLGMSARSDLTSMLERSYNDSRLAWLTLHEWLGTRTRPQERYGEHRSAFPSSKRFSVTWLRARRGHAVCADIKRLLSCDGTSVLYVYV